MKQRFYGLCILLSEVVFVMNENYTLMYKNSIHSLSYTSQLQPSKYLPLGIVIVALHRLDCFDSRRAVAL